jgi:nucleotide-binding universal stress UspA family protein
MPKRSRPSCHPRRRSLEGRPVEGLPGPRYISRPIADRLLATHDAGMVWTAQLSDPPSESEAPWAGHDWVGVEATIVCGLDGHAGRGATAFAAGLARRLGWHLSLVPLALGAPGGEPLRCLLAAATRDRAGLVVTDPVQAGAATDVCIELWRSAPCPLIALPQNAPGRTLETGPVLCGIDSRGPAGPAAGAAARLAKATGARLQLAHVVTCVQSSEPGRRTDPPRGVVWHALHALDLSLPVELVIQEGEPAKQLCDLATQEGAALLTVGVPSDAAASRPDGVVATLLRDSPVPLMLVPGALGVPRPTADA